MDRNELFAKEEKCQKAIRTVRRAVLMRLAVTAVLIWAMIQSAGETLALGLLTLALVLNLTSTLPLVAEWKKQHARLKELIAME